MAGTRKMDQLTENQLSLIVKEYDALQRDERGHPQNGLVKALAHKWRISTGYIRKVRRKVST